jgi:hypothetical protein
MSEKEILPYLIFVRDNPPQRVMSSENLIRQWENQLEQRAKKGDWWRPIKFTDETNAVVAAITCHDIISIIQGAAVRMETK